MIPKDLKVNFSSDGRTPVLQDRFFYLPKREANVEGFCFPSLSDLFGNPNPIVIEYCSGNGHWIVDRASRNPSLNFIAVELRFERARKIWAKMKNSECENLLVVCGEAFLFTELYLKEQSISEVYINFPDPWPKRRQQKNRLIRMSFLDELARILKREGLFKLVTDDQPYMEEAKKLFLSHAQFQPVYPSPYHTEGVEGYGSSTFQELWTGLGRTIYSLEMRKIGP